MSHIFGPVSSRRLGASLGVDLIPHKTCTFDCIYCEVGRTTKKTVCVEPFVSAGQILEELDDYVKSPGLKLDYITLAGSGEPTLNANLKEIVRTIKKRLDIPLALLTNGSLFFEESIRSAVRDIDLIVPSLDCAEDRTFQLVNRPSPLLRLEKIVSGLESLRRECPAQIWLETLFVNGMNDDRRSVELLHRAISAINPDRVQINTVARPPAYASAQPSTRETLEEIKTYFGERAEIIVSFAQHHMQTASVRAETHILDLLRRRPCPLNEISQSIGIDQDHVRPILQRLIDNKQIHLAVHNGVGFYQAG